MRSVETTAKVFKGDDSVAALFVLGVLRRMMIRLGAATR
jgi:hypothetical protein